MESIGIETAFILVVHDDPETANSIRRVLRLGDFSSVIVDCKADAEEILRDNTRWHRCLGCVIDIGLLDGASAGWDLARWIRKRESQLATGTNSRKRLIGVTAHMARAHFFDPQIFDVGLQTPYAPAKLLEALLM
jgi:CheY-like chemotaxis protein